MENKEPGGSSPEGEVGAGPTLASVVSPASRGLGLIPWEMTAEAWLGTILILPALLINPDSLF